MMSVAYTTPSKADKGNSIRATSQMKQEHRLPKHYTPQGNVVLNKEKKNIHQQIFETKGKCESRIKTGFLYFSPNFSTQMNVS